MLPIVTGAVVMSTHKGNTGTHQPFSTTKQNPQTSVGWLCGSKLAAPHDCTVMEYNAPQ